jgi:hypothetical protein
VFALAAGRHGVPELCAVQPHDSGREHQVWTAGEAAVCVLLLLTVMAQVLRRAAGLLCQLQLRQLLVEVGRDP